MRRHWRTLSERFGADRLPATCVPVSSFHHQTFSSAEYMWTLSVTSVLVSSFESFVLMSEKSVGSRRVNLHLTACEQINTSLTWLNLFGAQNRRLFVNWKVAGIFVTRTFAGNELVLIILILLIFS